MPNVTAIRIGEATVHHVGDFVDVNGAPFAGPRCENSARRYHVEIPGEWTLIVDDIQWAAGPEVRRDLRVQGTIDRPTETPNRGLKRIGVYPLKQGGYAIELKQCRQKHVDGQAVVGWSKAALDEIASGAGVASASDLLMEHGAHSVGPRGEIGWEGGPRNSYQCVTFSSDATDVPIIAYTMCVVLPVARRYA